MSTSRDPAAFAALVLVGLPLLVGCSAYHPPVVSESLELVFDDRIWTPVYRDHPENQLIVQYVPDGQTADAWEEMVTERAFKGLETTTSADQAMHDERKLVEEQCKAVTWNVVAESPGSVIYESTQRECTEREPAHEIGRFLESSKALYQITYRTKQETFPDARRRRWIESLTEARIVETAAE